MVAKKTENISLFLQYDMNIICGTKWHAVRNAVQGMKRSGLAWLLEGTWKLTRNGKRINKEGQWKLKRDGKRINREGQWKPTRNGKRINTEGQWKLTRNGKRIIKHMSVMFR